MLAELRQHHEKIGDLLTALQVLCQDRHADIVKVSAVRIELTRASRARSAYLNAIVYPKVTRNCPADKRIALEKRGLTLHTEVQIIGEEKGLHD